MMGRLGTEPEKSLLVSFALCGVSLGMRCHGVFQSLLLITILSMRLSVTDFCGL